MSHLVYVLFVGGKLLEPVLVNKSKEIYKQLGMDDKQSDYNNLLKTDILNNNKVFNGENLFPRLDVAKEVAYVASLMAQPK